MNNPVFKREDFSNQVETRWCPGCGDYAILAAIQRMLPELDLPPEKHVFISGIGCAGRLPYYMNTYGFHTIHGRALAVATGLAAIREDLNIWVITGDGDALSIGGNHLLHCLRRNVNINILLINNRIYGLTKGQFSPTSQMGQVTKTSPHGVMTQAINPLGLALAAGGSFIARAVDKDPAYLATLLKAANQHKGTSFIEIYQDCHIFNEGAFDAFALKNNRSEQTLSLQAGKPLLYGENLSKGLQLKEDQLIQVAANEVTTCHNPEDSIAAMRLMQLTFPQDPVPVGVYYQVERDVFKLSGQRKSDKQDLEKLYRAKASWVKN